MLSLLQPVIPSSEMTRMNIIIYLLQNQLSALTSGKQRIYAGFEDPTALNMKCSLLWEVIQHSSLKDNRYFDIPPKRRMIFNGLHIIISQKSEI
jgi:hypothetical protein